MVLFPKHMWDTICWWRQCFVIANDLARLRKQYPNLCFVDVDVRQLMEGDVILSSVVEYVFILIAKEMRRFRFVQLLHDSNRVPNVKDVQLVRECASNDDPTTGKAFITLKWKTNIQEWLFEYDRDTLEGYRTTSAVSFWEGAAASWLGAKEE